MIKIISDKNVKNNQVITLEELNELLMEDKYKIYEVIRVIDGKPIFFREHFDRMINSLILSGYDSNIQFTDFSKSMKTLITENNFKNCNVRVSYFFDNEPCIVMYYVKSSYPDQELYKRGINVVTVKKQRKNPNVKYFESDFRDFVDKILAETKAFEAVLVNEDDTISEGSKSNVFFVKGKILVTSEDSVVLQGITRLKVIEVCENNGIKVDKRRIYLNELSEFDAAFITGTSNNVLPISVIDDIKFDSVNNEIVMKASELYIYEMFKEYQ